MTDIDLSRLRYPVPAEPKIYHIVHLDRLASILADDGLLCHALMSNRPDTGTMIGMSEIKTRRLSIHVDCNLGTFVGEYVPFYFCARSVMLYLIWKANHPGLTYRGGQEPILHLEADLYETVQLADRWQQPWAFSLSNAGSHYAEFCGSLDKVGCINWPYVAARNFSRADVKEGKQAEFLMHRKFPWQLVRRVGTHSQAVGRQVVQAMASVAHRPPVETIPSWYY